MPVLSRPQKSNSTIEFVLIMALLTALNPFSLDALLPAFKQISQSLKLSTENDIQLVISLMILGMVLGEFIFGPLSDSFGRKKIILIGIGFYLAGTCVALISKDMQQLLLGRIIQGFGVSAPKIVARAMIRDRYEGDKMASVLSMVLMIVVFTPMIAPACGQALMAVFGWRGIFAAMLLLAVLLAGWLSFRQPETHPPVKRRSFSKTLLIDSLSELAQNCQFVGCTCIAGLTFAVQLLFLSTAPLVFEDLYSAGERIAFYFAVLALSLALALLLNSRLVMKFGMFAMIKTALLCLSVTGLCLMIITLINQGIPRLWVFMLFSFLQLFGIGIVFGNINALALNPLAHIAGFAASVIASLSSLIAVIIAVSIGRFYDHSILPLAVAFAVLPACGYVLLRWTHDMALDKTTI